MPYPQFDQLAVVAVGVTRAACGQPYEIGLFAMRFDGSPDDYLANAVVSAGSHDDAFLDFVMFTAETMGYVWRSWVGIEASARRRTVTVIADTDDDGMKVYETRRWDDLPDDVLSSLEEPLATPPMDLFLGLVKAVAPLVTVWPVDDDFMRTLPDRAPPWPYPEAEAEIAGLSRWKGEGIS